MILSLAIVSLLAITADEGAERQSELTGVIATRVEFRGAGKVKMIEACLDLLASCRYWHHPNEGRMPDWDEMVLLIREGNRGHLHIKLAEPRTLKLVTGEEVKLSEMLVMLPLNRGSLFVREGQSAKAYAKYEHDLTIRVQEQMKYALPAS